LTTEQEFSIETTPHYIRLQSGNFDLSSTALCHPEPRVLQRRRKPQREGPLHLRICQHSSR